jgi:hypothetical protein
LSNRTTTQPDELKHKHYAAPQLSYPGEGRGAHSLGLLSMIVVTGESAKYNLAFTPNLSNREVLDYQRNIWSAKQAKLRRESVKVKWGYAHMLDPKIDEIESQNFDEALKQNVQVDIYIDPNCQRCNAEALNLEKRSHNIGSAALIDGTSTPNSLRKWRLETWPHIEVNGREVTTRKLEELISDARYIRALEARKKSQAGV